VLGGAQSGIARRLFGDDSLKIKTHEVIHKQVFHRITNLKPFGFVLFANRPQLQVASTTRKAEDGQEANSGKNTHYYKATLLLATLVVEMCAIMGISQIITTE